MTLESREQWLRNKEIIESKANGTYVKPGKEPVPEKEIIIVEAKYGAEDMILHNDDANTFNHVIVTLMHICQYDPIQAEQCATLVHHKGRCSVKEGGETELELIKERLQNNNLIVTIEE